MQFLGYLSPQAKLYLGIFSISSFPIIFYFFSKATYPSFSVFLLFFMVFLLSLPGAIHEVVGERKSTPALKHIRKAFTPRILGVLLSISVITISANLLVINSLSHGFSPSLTQALLRSETVFVALGGILIFKETFPHTLPWVITLIIVAFTVMGYEHLIKKEWGWGDIFILHVLLASLGFGSFQIIAKFIIHDLSVYFLNGVRSLISCLLLLPWVYPYFSELTGEILLLALFSALAGPFLGRNVILSCTRDLPLNYIGCHLSLTPIFSLGLEWLILDRLPTNYEIIGGGIIVGSVLLFNLGKKGD